MRDAVRNAQLAKRNDRLSVSNTSGHKGVRWSKGAKKWLATIGVNGEPVYLGVFANLDDAVRARKAAEKKYWK